MHHSDDDNVRLRAAKAKLDSLMGSHSIMPNVKMTVRTTVETNAHDCATE
jgi:hypothetical protein